MSFVSQKLSSSSSYFKEIFRKVGIKLQPGEAPNILTKEQPLIKRDLQNELENHSTYPNNIPDFISGVKYFCQSKNLFKKALQPSIFQRNSNDDDPSSGREQECIFRILLCVDSVQSEVMTILLNEITNHADEEDNTVWFRLLLGPFVLLPFINDTKTLTTQLLEVLEIATLGSQIELLNNIPNIIPDEDHDETAKRLSTILSQSQNQSNNLTKAIIECLNHLNLSDDTKFDIQDHILAILNTTSSLSIFPLIFYFLVKNCKSPNLQNILLKTRNALDSTMESLTENEENKSDQVITFEEIDKINLSLKAVPEEWINLLNSIKSPNDHKPVDIIILMTLHRNRKHVIESIFKKKIKSRQFKLSLVETALQKYLVPQILKEYFSSILEISAFLLRINSEPICTDFAQTFYSAIFGHPHTNLQHRQEILHCLISFTGSTDKIRSRSLNVLKTIAEQHLNLLQSQAVHLMTLLDRIEEAELSDVKRIYDLLTHLTCGPTATATMEAYRNMIHIIVKKQLRNHKKSLKFSGVIGTVAAARNIATCFEEQNSNSSECSYSNISDLPNESAKQAAELLEVALHCTSNCHNAQGLYYDQLAQMIVTTENLDRYFLAWLQDTITNKFQNMYITSNGPEDINDIPLMVQYNLNSAAEVGEPIAVRIGDLTIDPKHTNNMLIFAPLFRLLRLITYKLNDKDLSPIDALLGCGVILPEMDPDTGIENYDSQQSKQVIDSLFHCINWFRESINAFVNQKSGILQQKVLQRLGNLIELEEMFVNSIKYISDHKLPPSYFYNTNSDIFNSNVNLEKTKSTKGRKRKLPLHNDTTKVTQMPSTTNKPGRKPQNKDKEIPEFNFRELDIDIILLLRYPTITEDNSITENKLYLTLTHFRFILKDVVAKLNTITKSNNANVFSHLITIEPEDLIVDCVKLMPYIREHLITIIDEIKKLLQRSDGIRDSHEMFLQTATELKICFSLNLEMKALVLSWSGFQNVKKSPLLRNFLRAFVDEGKSTTLISAHQLILEYLKCIMSLSDYCLTLPCAVHLINIVKALINVSTDETIKKKLITLGGKLLSNRWFNIHGLPESGTIANVNIEILVKAHLNHSNLKTINNIVQWIHVECSNLKSKDDNLTTFPSITKANFPVLFRAVCATLLEALQEGLEGLTNQEHLEVWLTTVVTVHNLMDIVKIQGTRTNLAAFLKKTLGIIKIFLAQGLPVMEIMLRSNPDKVFEILKTLQQSTRFIHNLCCHSKVTKDSTLIKHVPQMRLTLESLIYRVKAALVANNCSGAFWMGALKNKNLQGEEILSQSTNTTDQQEEDDNEDELPADEDSDEESTRSTTSGRDSSSIIV